MLGNNMFAYCGNDPINHADPSGLCSNCLVQKNSREIAAISLGACSGVVGGALVAVVAISAAPGIAQLSYEIWQALKKGVAEIYEYARSLMDYSISIYENSQPRVHHVIPVGDFSKFGAKTTEKLIKMRDLLASVDMTVNDPENLIVLSQGTHKVMHTKHYIETIYNIMMSAKLGDEASVRWALFFARQYAASLDQYSFGY